MCTTHRHYELDCALCVAEYFLTLEPNQRPNFAEDRYSSCICVTQKMQQRGGTMETLGNFRAPGLTSHAQRWKGKLINLSTNSYILF